MIDWNRSSFMNPPRNTIVLGLWVYPNGIIMVHLAMLHTDDTWSCYDKIPITRDVPAPKCWAEIKLPVFNTALENLDVNQV